MKKIWRLSVCCLLIAAVLVSCKGIEITGKTENVSGYTEAESMIVIGSERNRYQETFGPEIWELEIKDQQEENFEAYFIAKNKAFLQDIRLLNMLAEEKGVIATSSDMEMIRTMADAFYRTLSPADIAFMGNCTLEDATNIYTAYYVACKTVDFLLKNVSSEVSDADAKIIRIQQIVLSEREKADQLIDELNKQGASFEYYARQRSEDPEIQKTLARAEKEDLYYQTAFSLEEGEMSPVFSQDGKFYILKCIDAYDVEATQDRKEKLERSIRSNAFHGTFDSYREQHIVRFREPFWKNINLKTHTESTAHGFFEIFDEYSNF